MANASAVNMVALMELLAKSLVEKPDEVFVEEFDEPGQTVIGAGSGGETRWAA